MTRNLETKIIAETNKQDLFIIREFDAPVERIFRAFSETALLEQFFAPEYVTMKFDSPDYTSGFPYRYTQTDNNGKLLCAFKGVVHEMLAPLRIVQTSEMEGMPEGGHVVLEIFQFERIGENRTRLVIQDVCRSVGDRDAMLESGMQEGLSMIFDKLDNLLLKNSLS